MKKNYLKMFLVCISLLLVANTYLSAQSSIVLTTIKEARTKGINVKVVATTLHPRCFRLILCPKF